MKLVHLNLGEPLSAIGDTPQFVPVYPFQSKTTYDGIGFSLKDGPKVLLPQVRAFTEHLGSLGVGVENVAGLRMPLPAHRDLLIRAIYEQARQYSAASLAWLPDRAVIAPPHVKKGAKVLTVSHEPGSDGRHRLGVIAYTKELVNAVTPLLRDKKNPAAVAEANRKLAEFYLNSQETDADSVLQPFSLPPPQAPRHRTQEKKGRAAGALPREPAVNPANFGWASATTDPRRHNPRSFRYIIHAIYPYAKTEHKLMGSYDSSRTNLAKDPTKLPEKTVLWASLIDQDHRETHSDAGLILDVPPQNIISTDVDYFLLRAQDEGRERSEVLRLLNDPRRSIESPQEVLDTHDNRFDISSEDPTALLLTGTNPLNPSQKLGIAGVFIKVDQSGDELSDPKLTRKLKALAERFKVPVVRIPEE
ncbi:MAG: hypothetical protein HY921_07905 [Elusimicrobia bacterium]|nr:hypothetical protein [Elusimicrobiota bacterium]